MTEIKITAARPQDCDKVALLLKRSGLPIDDIDSCLEGFFTAFNEDNLVGTIGLEVYENIGLLRSLAVAPSHRGKGIGRQLHDRLLEAAQEKDLQYLYLLTTDADKYFARFGFKQITRDKTPDAIKKHEQFTRLCPDSAIVMEKIL